MMTYVVFGLLLAGILFWRIVLPSMKQVSGGVSTDTEASASAPTAVASVKAWTAKYFWSILFGIVGLVVIGFGLYGSSLKTPSLADAVSWSRQNWLWILVLWGILAILIAIHAKGVVAKTLQLVPIGVMFLLFLGFPFLGWLGVGSDKGTPPPQPAASVPYKQPASASQQQSRQSECMTSHPCALHVQTDGSTEKVSVPGGKQVCFEAFSWDNRDQLGYLSSYQGGAERKHTCTKQQVISGVCREPNLDTFRFVPEAGVVLPKYWFVPEGATQC